ncbi:MAG: hypothetical protein IPL40_05100 [Proteobacteria bacterium]|nr:hypothetical protein [Pseudomonadota bacterium]
MIPYEELCRALERFNQHGAAAGAPDRGGPAASAAETTAAPRARDLGDEVDLDQDAGVDISSFDDDGRLGDTL